MERGAAFEPISGSERVEVLDVLRGMGIVGILLVNVGIFSGAQQLLPVAPTGPLPIYDRITDFFISAFAEGKFISTLALLFGLGFTLQGMRAEERGESSGRLLLKRISVLALFGLVHAILIWSGDILLTYAIMGFVLILFRRRRPKTLLVWAGISLGLPLIFLVLSIVAFALFLTFGDPEQTAQSQTAALPFVESFAEMARVAYNSGSYPEMVAQRLRELLLLAIGIFFIGPYVFSMMLAGAAIARAGWIRNLPDHRAGIKRAARIGLSVGLPLNIAYGVSLMLDPASTGLIGLIGLFCWLSGAPILAVGYMASMALFVFRRPGNPVAKRLAAVGRLALSNYLLQSVVMTAIFYGLAIYGELGITASLAIALVLLTVQLALSPVYLRRFRSGPAEWLWRRLTYGRRSKRRVSQP